MTTPNFLTRALALAALAALAAHTSAQADGRAVYFGVGQKIVHVAELDTTMRDELGPHYGPEYALGFGYQTLAIAGLDIWTWDGGYCIYAGDTCDRVSATRSAEVLGVGERELGRPLSYTLKPGLLLTLVVAVLLYLATYRRTQQRAARPSASDDPRYQRALEIVLEGSKKLPLSEQSMSTRQRLDEGVAYLIENGIEESEARQQLTGLVDTVLEFRRRTAGHR